MGGYVKITFEDIEIAKNFFENDRHLDEFLVNVCKYYCGYENVFKYKNVKKFFETYKKTMDRVILGRSTGSIGGKKRIENQLFTQDTLEGGVQVPVQGGVEVPLVPKEIKEINIINEIKENVDPKQSFDDLLSEIQSFKEFKMEGHDLINNSDEFIKYFNVANAFRKLIIKKIESNGGSVEKLNNAKIGKWVKPIRDMYVLDKIDGKNIEMVYKWLPNDSFWSKVILSTNKLREQFNKLIIVAKDNQPKDKSKAIY